MSRMRWRSLVREWVEMAPSLPLWAALAASLVLEQIRRLLDLQ